MFTDAFERKAMKLNDKSAQSLVTAAREPFLDYIKKLEGLMYDGPVCDIDSKAFHA